MKLFYTKYGKDEGVDSNRPIEADVEYAINTFLELLDSQENFIRLIDENDASLLTNPEASELADFLPAFRLARSACTC